MGFVLEKNGLCLIQSETTFISLTTCGDGQANFAIDSDGYMWSWGSNRYGQASQGNYQYNYSDGTYQHYERLAVVVPTLVYTNTGELKNDWVKVTTGEWGSMALDSAGQLWGCGQGGSGSTHNCAAFGLPHDSGEDDREWLGIAPRTNYQYNFFSFTEVMPGFVAKDFMFNYYFTLLIGEDDYLYWVGEDEYYGVSGQTASYYSETPVRVTGVTDKVKLLMENGDYNYDLAGCVTVDNKVLAWGSGSSRINSAYVNAYTIHDLSTGLPAGVDIRQFVAGYACYAHVVTEDNNLYKRTGSTQFYNQYRSNTVRYGASQGYFEWLIQNTTEDGALYTKSSYYWEFITGVSSNSSKRYVWTRAADSYVWKDFKFNYHHSNVVGIALDGTLMTWGSNWYASHLGDNTVYDITDANYYNTNVVDGNVGVRDKSYVPLVTSYPEPESWTGGEGPFDMRGNLDGTAFTDRPAQGETHFPCGHWHKHPIGGTETVEEYPNNCWQMNLDVYNGQVFYVATGKFRNAEDGGFDLLYMLYDVSSHTWTRLWHSELILYAYWQGEAQLRTGIYGFFNYAYEMELIDDMPGYKVTDEWFRSCVLYNDVMNVVEFTSTAPHAGKGKMCMNNAGYVAVCYKSNSTTLLVQGSSDYGATFGQIHSVSTNYELSALLMDASNVIYLAYQSNATTLQFLKTANYGVGWTTIGSINIGTTISDIEVDIDGNSIVVGFTIASGENKFYRSTNNGTSFSAVTITSPYVNIPLAYHETTTALVFLDEDLLYRYVIDDAEFTVVNKDQIDDAALALRLWSSVLEHDLGYFAYTQNNLYIGELHRTMVFMLSKDDGETWSLIQTPLRYYDNYWSLQDGRVEPRWPFTKNVRFLASGDGAWNFDEQQDKWGYMEDDMYKT